jgi:hypothetical protein
LDSSGVSGVLARRNGARRFDLFGLAQGQPIMAWRGADETVLVEPTSLIRVGDSWLFSGVAMSGQGQVLDVYRVEAGLVRRLARLPRVGGAPDLPPPRLVRRALGEGVGVAIQAPGLANSSARDWLVVPLDPESGAVGEPIRLVPADLGGRVPRRCRADDDGWWLEAAPSPAPAFQVAGWPGASLTNVWLRLRMEPGSTCVDAIAALGEGLTVRPGAASPPDRVAVPLLVTDRGSGRRWELSCEP